MPKPKHHRSKLSLLLIGCLCQALAAPLAIAAETDNTAPRLSVVVLPFENETGDPDRQHWSHGAAERIESLLDLVKSIWIIPGSDYGMRELDLAVGDSIDTATARRIGELTEARYVVWGSWASRDDHWHLATRILMTASGEQIGEIKATNGDWFAVAEQAVNQILKTLRIVPTDAELSKMEERPTEFENAYEPWIRAALLRHENAPQDQIETLLRQAVDIDSDYQDALVSLAGSLFNQGKNDEAETLTRQALRQDPNDALAHALIAAILSQSTEDNVAAEREFKEAIRLDPGLAIAHELLGAIYMEQSRWRDAIVPLTEATKLSPFDSSLQARLGTAHVQSGDRETGLKALQEAERLNNDTAECEFNLGLGYFLIAEFPKAAQHLEKALALGRELDMDPELLRQVSEMLESAKARLTATFVESTRPQTYSSRELRTELELRLRPEEIAMAINPVEINPAMKAWVREQTSSANSDLDRAKLLSRALVHRVQGHGKGGSRTAQEVFELWDDPQATFSCQEYAKIYVGLAREIGLDAFYVHLEKDYQGRIVYHDCAAIFVEDKPLLVDPAYRWFGIPHQDFLILNDLETIAHHAFQPHKRETQVARCRLALKLHPDHA